ncbi:MAG: hypothetical protein QW123_00560 [Desulfurococcaceae archaeon]
MSNSPLYSTSTRGCAKVRDFRGFSLPKLREKDPELYSYVESIAR